MENNEAKYHVSRNGYLTRCQASTRACPLGGEHLTQSEYDKMVEEDDPRIPDAMTGKRDPNTYLGRAEQEYAESWRRVREYESLVEERRLMEKHLASENLLPDLDVEKRRQEFEEADKKLRRYYRKAVKKAGWVENGNLPDSLRGDAEYWKLYKEAYALRKTYEWTLEVHREAEQWMQKELFVRGIDPDHDNSWELDRLTLARKYHNAGVPDQANSQYLHMMRPEFMSVDADGKVNNVWVLLHNGQVERVVAYRKGKTGALLTKSGHEIYQSPKHETSRKEPSGYRELMVGPRSGKTFRRLRDFNLSHPDDAKN